MLDSVPETETGLPSTRPPTLFNPDIPRGSHHDNETRRLVVASYMQYGSLRRVVEITGVPRETIRDWLRSEWWDEIATNVRQQVEHSTRAKLQAIVTAGLDETHDRLLNGNEVLTKLGKERVKMSGRDAALVTVMMYDKLRLSLNLPGRISDNTGVKDLAAQLEALSNQVNAKVVSEQ